MTQNAKIGQHFVWVMVVRCECCRDESMFEASRRKDYLSKTACRIRILSPRECEVALFLHNGVGAPVASLRCAVLQKRKQTSTAVGSFGSMITMFCVSVPRCLTRWKLRPDGNDVLCERACPVRTHHVHSSEMPIEMGVGLETRRSCDQ